ncbi:hypothetical protein [Mycolicibacterium fortuitum]|nr:hypothetical protein [Mycolicibacterium fortuitum]
MNQNFNSADTAHGARRAYRMSLDLNRVGRPISAGRLEELLAGARPSEAELACLQALNRDDRARIARSRSILERLDAIWSRLWVVVIVLVTVALGLLLLSQIGDLSHSVGL